MDRRWSRRVLIKRDVSIYHCSLGLLRGCLHNLSYGGALIVSGEVMVPCRSSVELVFSDIDKQNPPLKISACAVHTESRGNGFMFSDYNTQVFRFLQALMSGA